MNLAPIMSENGWCEIDEYAIKPVCLGAFSVEGENVEANLTLHKIGHMVLGICPSWSKLFHTGLLLDCHVNI